MKNIKDMYSVWVEKAIADKDIAEELVKIADDEEQIEDAFYRDLAFGTGGLRGVIGAGTNRINIYTVAKASQGLADYVISNFSPQERKIAISYDSRIKSDVFAKISAQVFAANGIKVYIYAQLMPTPCLSYAVRSLDCAAGIMVTASHNPSRYNGYKVYGKDGCQITTEAADEILSFIEKIDIFNDVKYLDFEEGLQNKRISYIDENVYTSFIQQVENQSMLKKDEAIDKNVAIVYSPLNGTGLKPVLRVLQESGYTNITTVKQQEQPDGNFPTCPYPNPEIKEAMAPGVECAKQINADLLLATDPDCDRVGIAVKNDDGEYVLLSGNETGVLLLDYICSKRLENGTMPQDPVFIKTIVTIDMAERIAANYGVKTINVLTGFKFIGEQIGLLEKQNKESSYIFGFEESYGYLSGTYVRDKDAVDGAFLICEMFSYYKTKGISLIQKLNQLYNKYGYCLNTLHSFEFEGAQGAEKMKALMQKFRSGIKQIEDFEITDIKDYNKGIGGLPSSDVIKFTFENDCSFVVRPSGTEPKIKIYISITAKNKILAQRIEQQLTQELYRYFRQVDTGENR